MNAPQIIWIVMMAMNCTVCLAKNGELQELSFGKCIIVTIIHVALLYWGGFFS
jgi:hypothetical protein